MESDAKVGCGNAEKFLKDTARSMMDRQLFTLLFSEYCGSKAMVYVLMRISGIMEKERSSNEIDSLEHVQPHNQINLFWEVRFDSTTFTDIGSNNHTIRSINALDVCK